MNKKMIYYVIFCVLLFIGAFVTFGVSVPILNTTLEYDAPKIVDINLGLLLMIFAITFLIHIILNKGEING